MALADVGGVRMSSWTHSIIENFCMFRSMSKKEWKCYPIELKDWKKGERNKTKVSIHQNKNYIPPSERPKWCIKQNKELIPQFRCLCHGGKQCPFFAYTNADKKEYKLFNKVYNDMIDKEMAK